MPAGPSRVLEAIVGSFVPPACREEVLGDLCEKYTGPGQYVLLAMRVVPFVIVSRIRRTTDAYILLTEALLIYGSYLAAAWYTDKTLLIGQWGLLRLLIPTVLQLTVLIFGRAWGFEARWPLRLLAGSLIGISIYFNVIGGCASLLLVAAVEILLRPGADRPQAALGPALWAEPAVTSRVITSFLAAAAITIVAILLSSVLRPGSVGIVVIIVILGSQLAKSRRE